MTPLAEGFPTERRIENVASVRLTDSGISFLESNLGLLAGQLLGSDEGLAPRGVAVRADGAVFVATWNDPRRILRIDPDGTSEVVYWSPGARFYGLAVDDGFLFALDLTYRQLLRIPEEDFDQQLDALLDIQYPAERLDLVVVDNAPRDASTRALIERDYPSIRYVVEPRPGLSRRSRRSRSSGPRPPRAPGGARPASRAER